MSIRRVVAAALLSATGIAIADDSLREQALSLFGRIQATAPGPLTPEAELGRALFWDKRVSSDGNTSCATCHEARDWGADHRRYSPDAKGKLTSRNSPTVFNSMGMSSLRWLGDRKTGAEQAEGSMTGSLGFASKDAAVERLRELQYLAVFRKAYPDDAQPLSAGNYGRALAAYQATLTTPAPFDRFVAGEDSALTEQQKSGLRAFISTGCVACHNGALFGGAAMQRFGIVKDYWLETGSDKVDMGRFTVTKKEEDRYVFRVPTLRNIAKTAPYFHDGSVESLERAVRIMASVQLGRTLDDATTAAIVDFLGSLTGEIPSHYAPPEQQHAAR